MPSSTENVKLGVCNVFFDGVDLGLTKGGVEVTVTTETYKTEVDQYGKTAVKEQIMGRNVTVKVPLAETTIDNIAKLMPGATKVTDPVTSEVSLVATTGTGIDLLALSKELRLHPIANAANDHSEDFVLFKAATAGALNFAYKLDAERIFNADFTGYPDTANGGRLFGIGIAP